MFPRLAVRPVLGACFHRLITGPLFLLLALLGNGVARAQQGSEESTKPQSYPRSGLENGEIVRLTFRDGSRQEWRLSGATEDALLLIGNPCAPPTRIPFTDVRRIERRENGNVFVGFLGGTLAGSIAGGLVTRAYVGLSNDPYAGYWGLIIVPVGALTGMVAGTILGAQPRWHPVTLEPGTETTDPELTDVDRWEILPPRRTSTTAVVVGGAVGLGAGLVFAAIQSDPGPTVAYAMGGLILGAVTAGIAASQPRERSEWQKLFVVPQKQGVVVGYSTRF